MEMRNDADRREELSRAMRRPDSGYGGSRKTHGHGNRLLFGLLLAALFCGGLFLWSYANHKTPFYIFVGDQSAEQQSEEKQGETPEGLQNGLGGTAGQGETGQEPYEVPEMARVLLMTSDFSSIYHESLVLQGNLGEITVTAAGLRDAYDDTKAQLMQEEIILEKDGDCYILMPEEPEQSQEPGQTGTAQSDVRTLTIRSISRACGTPSYRGCLYLYIRNDHLVLVNELTLEEYLYGVLPSEMPASYQEEALKAQAVCARTYACSVMENPRYPEFQAQLDDSTSCQVYGNLAEHENTSKAVDATRGEILLFRERPVSTYYYSTSCGIGSDIGVWQGFSVEEYPYLTNRSQNSAHEELKLADDTEFAAYLAADHADTESGYPWYRWNCQISGVDADAIYEKLIERYRVKQEGVELVGADTSVLPADALPHPGRIQMLSIEKRNPSGCAVCLLIEGENCSYRVHGEYNVRYLLCDGNTTVTRQDGSTAVMSTILPSAYLILTPTLDKEELLGYSIMGGGYGHGVGMSQNGADALAASGMSYREILDYYYIGTDLKVPD